MKDATLCYIFQDGKVLLQKKAAGFGKGKWNAPGGKIKRLETPEKAAVREVREETGLAVSNLENTGLLQFMDESGRMFSVHIFIAKEFSGELRESREGRLKWFPTGSMPYGEMWEDDKIWLPKLLEGKRFAGQFAFTKKFKKMISHSMEELA